MVNVERNGDVSFWYADIGGLPEYRSPLPGSRTVDICIVGGGYTGLWTAYYLKKSAPHLQIVVIEREFAGFGASGRNGGWLSGGFGWSRDKYASQTSKTAVTALENAIKGTVAEVIRVAELENIDADIRWTEGLNVACTPAQMARVQSAFKTALEWGVPRDRIEIIDGTATKARINVKDALGAMVVHGVARVQPAKLVRGLAAAVERLGVTIFEQTTALEIKKGEVSTNRGTIKAEYIVRATEGFTAGIKGSERLWIPLNSAIVVTEPLSDEMWGRIGWQGHELLGDASHAYSYAQRTRGNRIAMGGRGVPYRFGSRTDSWGRTQQETIEKLHGILKRLLPQVADVRLDHAWCGVLGVPRDWCATVGLDRRTNIAWAGGYVGLGVSTSNLSGRTLADLILGKESELTKLPWVNREVRQWEPEPLRWLGVHAMYRLYHMADAREARSGGKATSKLAALANALTGR